MPLPLLLLLPILQSNGRSHLRPPTKNETLPATISSHNNAFFVFSFHQSMIHITSRVEQHTNLLPWCAVHPLSKV
jgi:hypothetical protein